MLYDINMSCNNFMEKIHRRKKQQSIKQKMKEHEIYNMFLSVNLLVVFLAYTFYYYYFSFRYFLKAL